MRYQKNIVLYKLEYLFGYNLKYLYKGSVQNIKKIISDKNMNEKSSSEQKKCSNSDPWEFEYLYPQRRGKKLERNWLRTMLGLEGKEEIAKMKCERNVYWCLKYSPLVKIMVGALNSHGCTFDMARHVSCEVCDKNVSGGFDPELNQVVICQNVAKRKSTVQGTLTHELIHMFDYCANEMDFRNIRHLACTEIRAANLAHCSFLSAWVYGSASPFNIKARHQECVKQKALTSVLAIKSMKKDEALKVIEEVFPKCYNDLEPIGRRCRRSSMDPELALEEAKLWGYNYKL